MKTYIKGALIALTGVHMVANATFLETSNQNARKPQGIMIHYTAADVESSRRTLSGQTEREVSAHYMIEPDGALTQLAEETKRTWHAGAGSWRGCHDFNSLSIGIELVGYGYFGDHCLIDSSGDETQEGTTLPFIDRNSLVRVPGSDKQWFSYPEPQIATLVNLCKEILERWNRKNHLQIPPWNIIGHQDYTARKIDPGPAFPWKRLAEAGIGLWPYPEDNQNQFYRPWAVPTTDYELGDPEDYERQFDHWFLRHLKELGYYVPLTNGGNEKQKTQQISAALKAFQSLYRPHDVREVITQESADHLASLCAQCAESEATKLLR